MHKYTLKFSLPSPPQRGECTFSPIACVKCRQKGGDYAFTGEYCVLDVNGSDKCIFARKHERGPIQAADYSAGWYLKVIKLGLCCFQMDDCWNSLLCFKCHSLHPKAFPFSSEIKSLMMRCDGAEADQELFCCDYILQPSNCVKDNIPYMAMNTAINKHRVCSVIATV